MVWDTKRKSIYSLSKSVNSGKTNCEAGGRTKFT